MCEIFEHNFYSSSSLLEAIFSGQRSPDLALCDFFLWGYLKSLVYMDRPKTLHLKNNICAAIADIGTDMLEKVDRNFKFLTFEVSFLKPIKIKL